MKRFLFAMGVFALAFVGAHRLVSVASNPATPIGVSQVAPPPPVPLNYDDIFRGAGTISDPRNMNPYGSNFGTGP